MGRDQLANAHTSRVTVDPDDLVTALDVANLIGVVPSAVSNWKRRNADFPKPVLVVSNGSVKLFSRREIAVWFGKRHPELAALLKEVTP